MTLKEMVKNNPNLSFKEFSKKFPCTRSSYYSARNRQGLGKRKKVKKSSRVTLKEMVKNNPTMSYDQFIEVHPLFKCTRNSFYSARHKLGLGSNGNRLIRKSKNKVGIKTSLDPIQKALLKAGSKDLAKKYYNKIEKIHKIAKVHYKKNKDEVDQSDLAPDPKNIKFYECKGNFDSKEELCTSCPVKIPCDKITPVPNVSNDVIFEIKRLGIKINIGKLSDNLSKMSETDRNDYFDMLKKSFFYRLSAEAIPESNKMIEDLNENLAFYN